MRRKHIRVLIACEFSGVLREAFRALGCRAYSCDLQPSERPSAYHIMGDVRNQLTKEWDLVIAHPPCQYLSNAGVRWRVERNEWAQVRQAANFFQECASANAYHIAIENPVMHKYAGLRKPDFTVQPWQFGDPFKKRTCFWTRDLPPLQPTSDLTHEDATAQVHREPPGPNRVKNRSRTYPGMARAIAEQWEHYVRTGREWEPDQLAFPFGRALA